MANHLPQPGELRRRILLRLWTDMPSGAFGLDQTFSAGIALWAKWEPIHSIAIRAGAQTGEEPTDMFWVRWATGTKPQDITSSHVIELAGRRYRVIEAIDVNGANQFTRISTKDLGAIP
jgi:head-tail adaptor